MVNESGGPPIATRLIATRTLAAIAIANGLSFSLSNALLLPVALIPLVYIAALACSGWMMYQARPRRTHNSPGGLAWTIGLGFAVALSLPRLVYPLEWLPGHTVDAMFDDYARLAELASMLYSGEYPLRHPANSGLLMAFYYAAFYPMALLKQLLPFITLKDAIFIGSALYFVLLGCSLVEVSHRLLPDRASALVLLFLCTWFGGLDWVFGDFLPFHVHSEWWARRFFEKPSQWSGFLTASQWTVHHFLGFYLCVLAWVFLRYSRFRKYYHSSREMHDGLFL